MKLTSKDKAFVVITSTLWTSLSLLAWRIVGEGAWIISLGALAALVLATHFEIYRRLLGALGHYHSAPTVNFRQVEALFSMFASLKIDDPLPPMRAAAISPDFANTLIRLIREHRPRTILEAGSGVSTVIAAYCLRQLGEGRIFSLEQDSQYAKTSRGYLAERGLQDIASVVHAPLKSVVLSGQSWEWYDTGPIDALQQVDMLIVDGPLQEKQEMRLLRYPAGPLLFKRLSSSSIIILDDADREDERRVVNRWLTEFDGLEVERLPSEKGTVILRRIR